jgi:hypothetical protein
MFVAGSNMVTNAFVIMVRNAAADLGMMVIQRYAHPRFVMSAQSSGHRSKSASPIPVERK